MQSRFDPFLFLFLCLWIGWESIWEALIREFFVFVFVFWMGAFLRWLYQFGFVLVCFCGGFIDWAFCGGFVSSVKPRGICSNASFLFCFCFLFYSNSNGELFSFCDASIVMAFCDGFSRWLPQWLFNGFCDASIDVGFCNGFRGGSLAFTVAL